MTDDSHKEWIEKAIKERKRAAKEMAKDDRRTPRQREVEACYGKPLPDKLEELKRECRSKTDMLKKLNEALEANGYDSSLSRPTLYNWLDEYGLR